MNSQIAITTLNFNFISHNLFCNSDFITHNCLISSGNSDIITRDRPIYRFTDIFPDI